MRRCVLPCSWGAWGYAPPENFAVFGPYKVVSEGILNHLRRFVNTSMQLYMHAMPRGQLGHKGGKRAYTPCFASPQRNCDIPDVQ